MRLLAKFFKEPASRYSEGLSTSAHAGVVLPIMSCGPGCHQETQEDPVVADSARSAHTWRPSGCNPYLEASLDEGGF